MDRSTRQFKKLNRERRELADIMTQMDLTDVYRAFHPKEYIFFSAHHGTFSKTDHIFSNKANPNRYQKKRWNNPLYLIKSPWFRVRI